MAIGSFKDIFLCDKLHQMGYRILRNNRFLSMKHVDYILHRIVGIIHDIFKYRWVL